MMKYALWLGSLLLSGAVQAGMTYSDWPPETYKNELGHLSLDDPMYVLVPDTPEELKIGVTLFYARQCSTPRCKQLNEVMEMGPIHSFQKDVQVRGRICDAVLLGQQGAPNPTPYRCLDDVMRKVAINETGGGLFYIRDDDPVLLGKAKPPQYKPMTKEESEAIGTIGISQEEFDKAIPSQLPAETKSQ